MWKQKQRRITVMEADRRRSSEQEVIDPRIRGELERLNTSTHEINCLEKELEETQAAFHHTLKENAVALKTNGEKLRKSIDQARPYYEAVQQARLVQTETQKAALKYEKSCSALKAAKEMVSLTEQSLLHGTEHGTLDPTWQEMMNHATIKVTEAENDKVISEKEHRDTAQVFNEMGNKVSELQKRLKSSIKKSRPYFEVKAKYQLILESQKKKVGFLQSAIIVAKNEYSDALKNLEIISDEIHEMRRNKQMVLEPRQQGVGAEAPPKNLLEQTDGELGPNPAPRFSSSDINLALQLSAESQEHGTVDVKSVFESNIIHSEQSRKDSAAGALDEECNKMDDECKLRQPANEGEAKRSDSEGFDCYRHLGTGAGRSKETVMGEVGSCFVFSSEGDSDNDDDELSSRSSASGATDDEDEENIL